MFFYFVYTLVFTASGVTPYNERNCARALHYFTEGFFKAVAPRSSPGRFETAGTPERVRAGTLGELELVGTSFTDTDRGMVSLARNRDGTELIVKQFRSPTPTTQLRMSPNSLGGTEFSRSNDPLLGEYAFAYALSGLNIIPRISWISEVSWTVNGASRTIAEEPVGQSVHSFIVSELKKETTPLKILDTILDIGREGFKLMEELHYFGIVHGDLHFGNLIISPTTEGGPLRLIDMEYAAFRCGEPENSPIDEFLIGSAFSIRRGVGVPHDLSLFVDSINRCVQLVEEEFTRIHRYPDAVRDLVESLLRIFPSSSQMNSRSEELDHEIVWEKFVSAKTDYDAVMNSHGESPESVAIDH